MEGEATKVKRCSNPKCPRKARVYLNGATECDLCHSPLVVSDVTLRKSSLDLLKSMSDVRRQVKTLVKKRK